MRPGRPLLAERNARHTSEWLNADRYRDVRILGLDIGGANIKAATADGCCRQIPFAMWRHSLQLSETLKSLADGPLAEPDLVALTMTAELADCFETKEQGVRFVIEAVQAAFPACPIRVWLTTGEFAETTDALELPTLVAAANWHVLATWAGRAVPHGPALLIDVGSTTTDVIPLLDGLPNSSGLTDLERLLHHELVYTGARRTPVCAIVQEIPVGAACVPIAAELFATSRDVHLLTGDLPEDACDCDTADGRPATRRCAMNRLAHLVCCDGSELTEEQLLTMARHVADHQIAQIAEAITDRLHYACQGYAEIEKGISGNSGETASEIPAVVLLSGSGQFLAQRALSTLPSAKNLQVLNLSDMYGGRVAEVACAFAAARLCADQCLDALLPERPL